MSRDQIAKLVVQEILNQGAPLGTGAVTLGFTEISLVGMLVANQLASEPVAQE